jgi:hypothetical protein
MSSVIEYRALSTLQPIRLKYEYNHSEKLNRVSTQYAGGLRIESIKAFKRFEDASLNKGNSLILTNTIKLSDAFFDNEKIQRQSLKGTVLLQLGTTTSYYMTEEPNTNRVTLSREPSLIHAINIDGTDQIELLINGKYVQIEKTYPYTAYLSETSLDEQELNRQRFTLERVKNVVSFRAKVVEGFRYLAFNNDDILRATGTVLNNAILNNYKFNAIEVTAKSNADEFNIVSEPGIVSYHMSFQDKKYNNNVFVRERRDVQTNLLASFSIYEALETGEAVLNFANLRTNYTPEGTPLTIPLTSTKVQIQGVQTPPTVIVVPPVEPPPPPPEVIPDNTLLKEDGYPLVQENNDYITLE